MYIYTRVAWCRKAFRSIAPVTSLHRTRRWFMRSYRVKTSGKRERTRRATRFLNATPSDLLQRRVFISFDYIRHITAVALLRKKKEEKKQTDQQQPEPSGFLRAGVVIYIYHHTRACVLYTYKYNKRDFTSARERERTNERNRVTEQTSEPVTFSRPLRARTPMMNRSSF
jgi:hypothetical protein